MADNRRDPVCNMDVDEQSSAGRSEYEGQNYYFCSAGCKDEFDENPQQYANRGEQGAGQTA